MVKVTFHNLSFFLDIFHIRSHSEFIPALEDELAINRALMDPAPEGIVSAGTVKYPAGEFRGKILDLLTTIRAMKSGHYITRSSIGANRYALITIQSPSSAISQGFPSGMQSRWQIS